MLFHATYEALLPSIKENGLVPGSKSYNEITEFSAIYFANDPGVAYSMVECAEYDEDVLEELGEIVVLAIHKPIDNAYFKPDPQMIFDSEQNIFSVAYTETIPPESISVYHSEDKALYSLINKEYVGEWDKSEENFYNVLKENGVEDGLRIDPNREEIE